MILVACVRWYARLCVAALSRLFVRCSLVRGVRSRIRSSFVSWIPRVFLHTFARLRWVFYSIVPSFARAFLYSFVHVRLFTCSLVRSLLRVVVSSKHVDATARQHDSTMHAALRVALHIRSEHSSSALYIPVSYTHLTLPTICSV